MQQFNLKYFNNISNIINRPDLLWFNMKVTTDTPADTTVYPDMPGLTAYRLERYFWKHIVAGETGETGRTSEAEFKHLYGSLWY